MIKLLKSLSIFKLDKKSSMNISKIFKDSSEIQKLKKLEINKINRDLTKCLIKIINNRCETLNYFNSETSNDESNYQSVKLYGHNNFIINNSKYININQDNIDKLSIKQDLLFNNAEIYLLLSEFFTINSILIDHNYLLKIIKNSSINNIKDLKPILQLEQFKV